MGDPRHIRKKYANPKRPWDKSRILSERDLLQKYGLASKKELRIMDALISKKRTAVKQLLAEDPVIAEKGKQNIIGSLDRIGLLSNDANISDVLGLNVEDILERRLETVVFRQGLSKTIKQSRQFILHGFISVNGRRVTVPSYLVKRIEENTIDYFGGKRPKVMDVGLKTPELQKKKTEEVEKDASEDVPEGKDAKTKGINEDAKTAKNVADAQ